MVTSINFGAPKLHLESRISYGGLRVVVYPPGCVLKQELSIVLRIVPFSMKMKIVYMRCFCVLKACNAGGE